MPGLLTVATEAASLEQNRLAAYLTVLDRRGDAADKDFATFVFQHYPATISIAQSIGWTPRAVAGLSHELVGWGAGGGRSVSFTAEFGADEDLTTKDVMGTRPDVIGRRALFSPDLRAALAWITALRMPERMADGSMIPPRRLQLTLEGSKLGLGGVDTILCVLDETSAEIDAFFASGAFRTMSIPLTFREIIQQGDKITSHSLSDYSQVFTGAALARPLYSVTIPP